MKNHWFWMLVACALPLLLIFLLPVFGVTGNVSFFLFVVVFFLAHLFMMGRHSHNGNYRSDEKGHHH